MTQDELDDDMETAVTEYQKAYQALCDARAATEEAEMEVMWCRAGICVAKSRLEAL